MTGNLPAAGTLFLIAPSPGATTTARELHEMLAERFPGTGLGITGMQSGCDAQPCAGRAFSRLDLADARPPGEVGRRHQARGFLLA